MRSCIRKPREGVGELWLKERTLSMNSKWNISVEQSGETIPARQYTVRVKSAGEVHVFEVVVDKKYPESICGKQVPFTLLVQYSFMFLLEHESPKEILKSFDLKEIQSFFDDYEDTIKKYFS